MKYQTTPKHLTAFNPPAYRHGRISLSVNLGGRALISNCSEGRSKGTALMIILERTPYRGSGGLATGDTTLKPQTARHSLTSNQKKTQRCCYALIHQSTETGAYTQSRMPYVPTNFPLPAQNDLNRLQLMSSLKHKQISLF